MSDNSFINFAFLFLYFADLCYDKIKNLGSVCMKYRIWEIDFLRGIAIILMVIYHIVYDLAVFFGYMMSYSEGFWFFIGRSAAVLFIILSGISTNFSSNIFKRSLVVLAAAMLVTFATYLFDQTLYVRFGILHCIGVCMAIAALFSRLDFKPATLTAAVLASAFFFAGAKVLPADVPFFGLLWRAPPGFNSMDYYPLFPWAGLFFCGMLLGKFLYKDKKPFFKADFSNALPVKALSFLGKHSLVIYLAHQPVIMPILFIIHMGGFS
jgi:uncharacterized membrane protein